MRLATLAFVVGCSHPRPTPVAPVAPAPPPATVIAPKPAVSPFPVPMRVMAWTSDGVQQIGTFPDAPPATYPPLYYVEPMATLDDRRFDAVVTAVRDEHVPGLSLRGQPITGSLGKLRELPELKVLLLDDTTLDDAGLDAIDVALERLYVARTQITDAALSAKLATLRVLDVEDCGITDAGLQTIASFGELRALNVAGTRITDKGGAVLGKLTKVNILDLGGTRVGPLTIAAIRPLALTELFIDRTHVGKEIGTLAGYAPGLMRFDASALAAYKPVDADVEWLAKAPYLVEAGLSGAKIHDPLARAIAARPNLEVLRLASTLITTAAIDDIAKLTKLEEIDLALTPVTDAQAIALLGNAKLRALRLDDTPITDKALDGMVRTPPASLRELYLSRTRVTDKGLAILDALPRLEGLGLGETDVRDATVARIGKLAELHTLVLTKSKASHDALAALAKLPKLERLYLDDTRTDDDTIAALASARGLRALHIAGTDVSADALPTLRTFRQLDELTIGDTRVGSAITALDAWPHLRTLSLVGLQITDGSLPKIAKRTSLTQIDLSATDITDPSPLEALQNLRALGLSNTKLSQRGTVTVKALAARGVDVVQ
jgi:internalin A